MITKKFIFLTRDFSKELYVLPDDDKRYAIQTCRSSESVLKKWFKINDIRLVHLLVLWYLVNLQDARCNNKDKDYSGRFMGFTMGNREHYSESSNEIFGSVTCSQSLQCSGNCHPLNRYSYSVNLMLFWPCIMI